MATYRKEKNLVYISIDGKGEYTFDINTGVLYGIRKKPIKTCPSTQAFLGQFVVLTTICPTAVIFFLFCLIYLNIQTPQYMQDMLGQ